MKDLILSSVINDSMIIQRGVPFPIWSKKKASVTFLDKTYESKAVNDKWLITLDPIDAGGPFKMQIECGNESVTINDIFAGDVWLCAGQSNMEMQMNRLYDDFSEEWDYLVSSEELGENNENNSSLPTPHSSLTIRQFKVPQEWDFSSPREDISGGKWLIPSKETLDEFAATPWFFAKYLYEKYKIPIGLIVAPWGGTPVESWMSEEALSSYPEKIAEGKKYASPQKRGEIEKITGDAIQEWETNVRKNDEGLLKQWQKPETVITAWNDITLPGEFSDAKTGELNKFCGVIWLAMDFTASEGFEEQDAKVWLGTIVDADTVFINGAEIGNTGYRYPPRKYVPKGLIKQGKNRIVIRVTCNSGEGGITCDKPFRIFTEKESIELTGSWKYKIGVKTKTRPEEFFFQRLPLGNFNAMIAPVLKLPLKGVIWYQGESNDSNPHDYEKLFPLMINDWRKRYRKTENILLPFLFVQLPIWKEETDNNETHHWAIIRDAQAKALSIPAAGMAAALELGEWNDIHPINKKDVGYRLFLTAEKIVFGVDNTSPGPLVREVRSDGKILIFFDNCGGGIKVKRSSHRGTEAQEESNELTAYISVISEAGQSRCPVTIEDKNVISVDVSGLKNPKKILYAWADNPRDRQLFNSDGLPMLPFKINLNKG